MRWRALLLVATVATATSPAFGTQPAAASIDGPCRATVGGQDVAVRSASDPGDAIDVDEGDLLVVEARADAPVGDYRIQLEFAGIRWTVAKGEAAGNSWRREVEVDDYARYGAGLYRVHGVSGGANPCDGAVLVKVGGNPLTTPLGLAGVGFVGIGVANAAFAARRARRGTR